jgi:hypothetical protein
MKTARRIAAAKALSVVAGLLTIGFALATGNLTVAMIGTGVMVAATAGPVLLAAAAMFVSEWREAHDWADEASRQHQMEAAVEQAQGKVVGIKERLAGLRACVAVIDGGAEGGTGRFRERLSAEPEPCRDRVH